jgi:hypothetical protein
MPIPSNYRDICEMLIKASDAGRVNWLEEGDTLVVRLPDYNLNLWSGEEEDRRFIAVGLKTPGQKGLIDNWYVDEGEEDFAALERLWGAARHNSHRVAQKLDELRKLLQGDDKIGLDDTEPMTTEGSIPGWTIVGNWEVPGNNLEDWEFGDDWIRGKNSGTVLWHQRLPNTWRIRFEARLVEVLGSDEIDVLIGDSMVLYYSEGVRLDYMTDDLTRDRNKNMVMWPKPRVGQWYIYSVVKTTDKCTLLIDEKPVMDIPWDLGRTIFRGRIGFAHWRNRIEFRNVQIEKLS